MGIQCVTTKPVSLDVTYLSALLEAGNCSVFGAGPEGYYRSRPSSDDLYICPTLWRRVLCLAESIILKSKVSSGKDKDETVSQLTSPAEI